MMIRSIRLFVPMLLMLASGIAHARPDMAVTARLGTPGYGLDYNIALGERFSARLGYSGLNYKWTVEETDASYDGKLNMSQAFGLLEWYVFKGGFRVTAGFVNSDSTVDITGKSTGSGAYTLGDNDYPTSYISSLKGQIKIGGGVKPYVGFGWGNPIDKPSRFTFMFDLGVIGAGAPKETLTAQCNLNAIPGSTVAKQNICNAIQNDVNLEIQDFKESTQGMKWWPVVSAGVAIRF